MSLKLAARLVTLTSAKIADLQENDTAIHLLDVSTFVPPGTKAILIHVKRISGTGLFVVYPSSGTINTHLTTALDVNVIPVKNQELKWANTVANDDWDLFLHGYFVQKRTR